MTPRASRRKHVDHSSFSSQCAAAPLVALDEVLANQLRIHAVIFRPSQQEGERPVVTISQSTVFGWREDAKPAQDKVSAARPMSCEAGFILARYLL